MTVPTERGATAVVTFAVILKTDPYAAVAGVTERLVVVAVCAFATTQLIKLTNATKRYVNEL